MMRKARLLRSSILGAVIVIFLIYYVFPRPLRPLQLRKKVCPVDRVPHLWPWPFGRFDWYYCSTDVSHINGEWKPSKFEWHLTEYNPEIKDNQTNSMLESVDWKIQVFEDVCDFNQTLGLAVVLSSVDHFQEREFIRKTWANPVFHNFTRIRTLFILGFTNNDSIQSKVEIEAARHDDILQISVIDSYRNLTYKTISALTWVQQWCKELPWIIKIDEDVAVNPFNLRKFLEKELRIRPQLSSIYGRLRRSARPWKEGKWKVEKNEYSGVFYPSFILGSAYIIGRNAVEKLITHVPFTSFLWLEDVFTTGLLARKAVVNRISMEKVYFSYLPSRRLISGNSIFCVGVDHSRSFKLWKEIMAYNSLPLLIDNG